MDQKKYFLFKLLLELGIGVGFGVINIVRDTKFKKQQAEKNELTNEEKVKIKKILASFE